MENEDLNEIILKFADKIKSELLCLEITKLSKPEICETVDIADEKIKMAEGVRKKDSAIQEEIKNALL